MRRLIYVVMLTAACTSTTAPEPNPVFEMTLDSRLVSNADGFYELAVNPNTTQTLHRISGHVFADGQPLEYQRVIWESSHSWTLSDSLSVIVRKSCPYSDTDIECLWYISSQGAVRDTVLLTQYVGEEVPTVNAVSISAPDGEINTIFAPVWWMVGDTVTITAHALFRTGEQKDSVRVILK
jgi:hypothetical protein